MRDKATVFFRHQANGSVVGEIIDASGSGNIVQSRDFRNMTDAGIERVLLAFKEDNSELSILPTISVMGN